MARLAPDVEVDAHLLSLVRKELVRPQEGGYAFRHQLIREAAYGAMPLARRADLHERLADIAGTDEATARVPPGSGAALPRHPRLDRVSCA